VAYSLGRKVATQSGLLARDHGSNGHKMSREAAKSGAFFRVPAPFVLFVSFVV